MATWRLCKDTPETLKQSVRIACFCGAKLEPRIQLDCVGHNRPDDTIISELQMSALGIAQRFVAKTWPSGGVFKISSTLLEVTLEIA